MWVFASFVLLVMLFYLSMLRSMRGYYLMYLLSIPPIDWWPESRYRYDSYGFIFTRYQDITSAGFAAFKANPNVRQTAGG